METLEDDPFHALNECNRQFTEFIELMEKAYDPRLIVSAMVISIVPYLDVYPELSLDNVSKALKDAYDLLINERQKEGETQ